MTALLSVRRALKRHGRGTTGLLVVSLALLGSPTLTPPAQATPDAQSDLRIGVLALAGAISAVGQTPELATPLPFTQTSVADALDLDQKLTANLTDALQGTDLADALDQIDGITLVPDDDPQTISFTYAQSTSLPLELVHDDGDLRFGDNDGAGTLDVSLSTESDRPFVVRVDPSEPDELLRTQLISQPVMDLSVDIDKTDIAPFDARQGFTEVKITGGHYRIHRERTITLRDPDGRGVLTLEDLRYSTLPDLFRFEPVEGQQDALDVSFAMSLPGSLTGGSAEDRTGSLSVDEHSGPDGAVWPTAKDATRDYGTKLEQATDLTMSDGLTSLAQYTGTVLALQDAANVDFPNLGGGTSDLFAPGDKLLGLLSSAAAAQIRCGAAPTNPPTGVAAPGDTVYCTATTADGLGTLSGIDWTLNDAGAISAEPDTALGTAPSGLVQIDGSDGEPDLSVSFTATPGSGAAQDLTARSMPRTVQDVVERISHLGGSTTATASLTSGRMDVAVDLEQADHSENLELGNPGTLGALVGLTGMKAPEGKKATATATGSSFDVGFGIQTGTPAADQARGTYLLPADDSLLQIGDLSATAPALAGIPARIGFLGVTADLDSLSLGKEGTGPAVSLDRATGSGDATDPLLITDLLTGDGALDPDQLTLTSNVTAGIGFEAKEQPLTPGGSDYATGGSTPASGSAEVAWTPGGLPTVTSDTGYTALRVFDPVPAAFLSGTATVVSGDPDGPDDDLSTTDDNGAPDEVSVDVTLPSDTTLYDALNVPTPAQDPGTGDVEVARRMLAEGLACQNVTISDDDTLTCTGLAPNGVAAWQNGAPVQLIVLGDPFAMRDSVIEGLAAALSGFDRITSDGITNNGPGGADLPDDQYTSTLPLVDLTPTQLAVERDALRQGLSAMSTAATADEQGGAAHPVSSAQELAESVPALVKLGSTGGFAPHLAFDLGADDLGIALSASTPANQELQAKLRFSDAARGQVSSTDLYDVAVDSTTTLAIDVDRETARQAVDADTGTSSTAIVDLDATALDHDHVQAGVTDFSVTGDGSSAGLGVAVDTDYVVATDGTGKFETTRTKDSSRGSAKAAKADLVIGDGDALHYAADATDSSGGTGTVQPPPDAMQVKYVAEGLDGLANALESAQDGAAPRNLGPGGAPISAPLIGTHLDAGAGVPATLHDLTSKLRDQLETATVTGEQEAAGLEGDLETAFGNAIDSTDGLANAGTVTASVTCTTDDGACDPDPCADATEDDPCTTDGPTGWDTVTVSTTLKSDGTKEGKTPFDTGLAGLAVHSNQKVDTSTSWSLPITLQLQRGVGPQVVIGDGDKLALDVDASMPSAGFDAVVGYLPAHVEPKSGSQGEVHTAIDIAPTAGTYDLFDLYDGKLTATPAFSDPSGVTETDGISLDFTTLAGNKGGFDLLGNIDIPWSPGAGYEPITYNDVRLDVGEVLSTIATPFAVVDPYLAPVRDVVDVLRTPIPVISDLSQLAGGDEVSLLSLLETLSAATKKPQLEMAHRVIGLVGGVTDMLHGVAALAQQDVPLEELSDLGAALTLEPSDVTLNEKCTQTVKASPPASTTGGTSTTTPKPAAPKPCPDTNIFQEGKAKKGAAGQTTGSNRPGQRHVKQQVARKTREITGQLPGFSLPFLSDPDQLMDLVTGEGEVSYFRLDLGTLSASVAYTQRFGPIMAGPIPIMPFVGGSISVEGRLAMGFDSHAQTLAAQSLSDPGDAQELLTKYGEMDGGDIIREGFYLDDLDSEGVDVPEVKIVTTLEAGAGVSIGIVTAGLKGGITLTINLDLNDPNDDGKVRTAEIRDMFQGNAKCIFDASATLEAFIAVFVEIQLLFTTLNYDFDLLRLGPYTLFEYGCPDVVPTLVKWDSGSSQLVLTSGSRSGQRVSGAPDGADDFKVRQFAKSDGLTEYEVEGFGRVQVVDVKAAGDGWNVTVYDSGLNISTANGHTTHTTVKPTFAADGGSGKDKLSFLQGEAFDPSGGLETTPFDTRITALTGGDDDDVLVTGAGNDTGIDGGAGTDSIDTGLGDDTATGGSGNDIMNGDAGRDDLSGGTGDDRIQGGPGADRARGEDGNDSLVGGPGRDVRAVLVLPHDQTEDTDGNDVPDVVESQVRLGFDSGDVLVGGGGADTVDGGDGSDVVVGGNADALTTSPLSSLFEAGTRTVNVLTQGDTNPEPDAVPVDTAKVPSDAQLDTLCESGTAVAGGAADDFVTGGAEADVVIGGDGADQLDGGGGPDEICGRAGDDQITGDGAQTDDTSNDDVIRGGHGDDRADGGPGNDVMFGDDVALVRGSGDDAHRVLNGSLGAAADGDGADYLDGGDGNDITSGGAGSDLLLGGAGDDAAYGEGRDTGESDGTAPSVSQRLLACNPTTRVVAGKVDLNGDLLAGAGGDGITSDDGRLAGLDVVDGVIKTPGGDNFSGLVGDTVVSDGLVDYDRDGNTAEDRGDTGMIPLASMLGTGANSDGDCILTGDGNDELLGGTGSDYLGAGEGTDLASGGDGNDLVLGDGGVDVLLGGPHDDVLVGGLGDDHLLGGNGNDRLRGNEGADDLVGGTDAGGATDGQDVLLGGRDADVLAAENADAVSQGIVDAVTAAGVPWTDEPFVPAAAKAGSGSSLRFDDSALLCGDQTVADRWLTILPSDGLAGTPEQSPGTPLAYDELYGGYDCDFVFGSTGDDLVRGGQDDDVVEAGPGADIAYGDDGNDVVIGGSTFDQFASDPVPITTDRDSTGVADSGDLMVRGDGGPDGPSYDGEDLVMGDNALPIRVTGLPTGPDYVVQLRDVASDGHPAAAAASGGDTMQGDGGVDRVFGQGGDDTIDGDLGDSSLGGYAGDDYLEGNDGADTITAGVGDDDVIGGSSATNGLPLGLTGQRLITALQGPLDTSSHGAFDRGTDVIDSGSGSDVVLGDNGRITRPEGTAAARQIARSDDSDTAGMSDGDEITSGSDPDRVFGQGGDDVIDAGAAADHVEGNEGADQLVGGPDEDVVIGGSSLSPDNRGSLDDAVTRARAQLDGGDSIWGDDRNDDTAASDLILGDNATVLELDSGRFVTQLADVARPGHPAEVGTSGNDTIRGGDATSAAPDRVFGQDGNDNIETGSASDYVEGNSGTDLIDSGAGDDDVIGGSSATNGRPLGETGQRLEQRMNLQMQNRIDTSAAGLLDEADQIHGGSGDDTVLGDNGRITRPTDGSRPMPDVTMADTGTASTYGSDELYGDDGEDDLYGQLDDGTTWGTGDKLSGGTGNDTLLGDLAVVRRTPASAISAPKTLALKSDAISEDVYQAGSIVPETWVPTGQAQNGGPDLAWGGDGNDTLHLGGGSDLGDGGAGDDAVFGGNGDDALWGDIGHDRIFGGYGDDDLDLKFRTGDPAAYGSARPSVDQDTDEGTTNGPDLVYGGWGADELQVDVGGAGKQDTASDHVIDWVGAHNVYYVCGGAYGAGRVIRQASPSTMDLLTAVAEAVGTRETSSQGSGGWFDLGMVYNQDTNANNDKSPENPGNFTCG